MYHPRENGSLFSLRSEYGSIWMSDASCLYASTMI